MAEQDVTHTLVKLDGVTARQINQNFRDVQQFVNGQTVHTDGTGLVAALDSVLTWQAWTPTLTAVTTNPTLGTGSSATGRFIRFGDTVIASARIAFGTSGVAAGSGEYRISLPVAAATFSAVGSGFVFDNSTFALRLCVAERVFASNTVCRLLITDDVVDNNSPWVWAASDVLSVHLVYEAA